MSPGTQVEKVVTLLIEAGYRSVSQPLLVANVPFVFAAALAGKRSPDLVVIIDTTEEPDGHALGAKVAGLARALDLVGSRKTLTFVVVGPRPPSDLFQHMARAGRVLLVGTPTGDDPDLALQHAVAVLLPLSVAPTAQQPTSWTAVRKSLLAGHSGDDVAAVFGVASRGADAVRSELRTQLEMALGSGSEPRDDE